MLRFTLEKFRAVDSADLELPGITVIAGKNGSGKSSISKVLYAMLDTATRFDVFVSRDIDKRSKRLFSDVVDLVLNFVYQLPGLQRDQVRALFPTSDTMSPQSWIIDVRRVFIESQHLFEQHPDVVSMFLARASSFLGVGDDALRTPVDFIERVKIAFDDFDSEKSEKTYSRPLDVLKERMLGMFEQQLDIEQANLFIDNDPIAKVATNRLDSPVDIKRVFYIDTPWVSDLCEMSGSRFGDRRLEHREHLARTLRSPIRNTSMPSFDVMQAVVHGVPEAKKTNTGYRLKFRSQEFNQVFDLFHCATGVKAFSVLQLLLASWKLDEATMLILDEPESNLHPEWIIEYARAIVLLHKHFGVKFLVSTHSTDLVAGIQAIAKKEKSDADVRFYLAERNDSLRYVFTPQGFDISKIFDSFNGSLDRIAAYGAEV